MSRFIVGAFAICLVVSILVAAVQAVGGTMVDIEQARAQIETARAAQEAAQAAQIAAAGLGATSTGLVFALVLLTIGMIGLIAFIAWQWMQTHKAQEQRSAAAQQFASLSSAKQLPGQPAGLDALVQLMILERLERMDVPKLPEYRDRQ